MPTYLWIIIAILIIILLWIVFAYNGLVVGRNRVDEAWSDIEVQLKRRYDLIPNLVQTVKSYAKHESDVFDRVTTARSAAMGAHSIKEHAGAEGMLTAALGKLFAVAEAYPDLKASQNFAELQTELRDAEDKISAARRFYNGNIRDYNIKLQTFPTNLMASSFGFMKREFFDMDDAEAKKTPEVKF